MAASLSRVEPSFIIEVVGPQITREGILGLRCEVVGGLGGRRHLACAPVVHYCLEGEVRGRAEEQHDHHAEDYGGLAELAFGSAAEAEVIAAASFRVFALALPCAHVGRDCGPGAKPEDDGEPVEGRGGVDVGEACGARPHGGHDKVEQDRDGEPALEGPVSCLATGGPRVRSGTDECEKPAGPAIC